MKIGKLALYGTCVLILVMVLFGCPGISKEPLSIKIDDQTVDEGNALVLELSEFVSGTNKNSLTFTKLSGVGTINGSEYMFEADYDASGTYEVVIKVENGEKEEAQDTFNITVNDVNRKPELELLTPQDGESEVPLNTSLTWNATDSDGDAISYNVYFGEDNEPPLIEEGITQTSYSVNNLDYETTYYWKVDAEDEKGEQTESSIWSFTTIPANTYSLTVTTSPDTGLEISINGINYLSPKTRSFTENASVNIGVTTPQEKDTKQEVPGDDTKYIFDEWNDGNNNSVREIIVDSDITYTAEMDKEYKVSTGTNPSGLVEINSAGWYDAGDSQTFTAPEVTGYTFHHWEVNNVNIGTDNPVEITIDSPKKVVAVYDTKNYSLTVTTSPDTGLDISIEGSNYTSPKTLSFTQDESVDFGVTTPQEKDKNNNVTGTDTKYTFNEWNDGNKNTSRTVVMDSNKTFTANMNKEYKVETGTNPEGITTIDGAGWYDAGDSHEFTAPNVLGYSFDHWEINGNNEGTDNPISVTIDSPKKIVAVYNTGDYAVTVTTTPDTGLDISFNGNPYTSPKTIYFNENDDVDIGVSSPQEKDNETNVTGNDTRYTLNQWNDGNTNPVRTVTITADVTYTAQMDVEYKVETGTTPEGVTTISGAGWYADGSNYDFTAPAVTGYTFDHWEINGTDEGSNNPINVSIDSPKKVTAVYTPNEYSLTINATNGTVNKDPDQTTYTHGTEVELEAIANEGYTFDHWEGDLTGTNNPDTIIMDSDKEVSAFFEVKTYTLSINTTGNGTVTKDPDKAIYNHGESVEIEAVPDAGWQFDHWEGDLTGTTNPENVTMNSDKEITAVFTEETYTLTINTTGNGSVNKDPDKTEYSYNESVELTASADEFWQFDHWEGDLTGSTNPDTITMDADKEVTAVFTEISSASLFIVDDTLNADSEVEIFIRAKNIDDVKGFQINVEYDPNYFISFGGSSDVEFLNQVSGFMKIVDDSEGLIEIAGASGESVNIVDENIIKITLQTGTNTGNTQIIFASGTEVRDSNTDLITVNITDKGNYLIE